MIGDAPSLVPVLRFDGFIEGQLVHVADSVVDWPHRVVDLPRSTRSPPLELWGSGAESDRRAEALVLQTLAARQQHNLVRLSDEDATTLPDGHINMQPLERLCDS